MLFVFSSQIAKVGLALAFFSFNLPLDILIGLSFPRGPIGPFLCCVASAVIFEPVREEVWVTNIGRFAYVLEAEKAKFGADQHNSSRQELRLRLAYYFFARVKA
jgi:hypothetical protein